MPLTKKKGHKRVKKTKTELENDMKKQLDKAMEQLESRQYYLKCRDYVTTVHEFGICFAGRLCLVQRRTRKKTQAVWTVEDAWITPRFQEREMEQQTYDSEEEAKLEDRERQDEYVEPAGSSSRHAAMEPEQTGARSSRKRSSSQQGTCDYRIFGM